VNLVYRHLAARGRLPAVWTTLRPLFADGDVEVAARRLHPPLDPLPPARVHAALDAADGATAEVRAAVAATMAAYERANRLNLVAFSVLASRPTRSPTARARAEVWALPAWPGALPTMVDPATLPPATLALLHRLALSDADDRPVPTLYRHLARWPDVLGALWHLLQPAVMDGTATRAAARLRVGAEVAAGELGADLPTVPDDVVTVVDSFCARIARMLVGIRLLEHLQGRSPA